MKLLSIKLIFILWCSTAALPPILADVTDVVTLTCHSSHMSVDVDLKGFTQIDADSLHLQDSACRPKHFNKTSASFRVPLQGCGTVRKAHDTLLIYTNAVCNTDRNSTSIEISRVPYVRMPFGCFYRPRYSFVVPGGSGKKRHIMKKTKTEQKKTVPLSTGKSEGFIVNSSINLSHVSRLVWSIAIGATTAILSTY